MEHFHRQFCICEHVPEMCCLMRSPLIYVILWPWFLIIKFSGTKQSRQHVKTSALEFPPQQILHTWPQKCRGTDEGCQFLVNRE